MSLLHRLCTWCLLPLSSLDHVLLWLSRFSSFLAVPMSSANMVTTNAGILWFPKIWSNHKRMVYSHREYHKKKQKMSRFDESVVISFCKFLYMVMYRPFLFNCWCLIWVLVWCFINRVKILMILLLFLSMLSAGKLCIVQWPSPRKSISENGFAFF